ncbi:hypothetical protein, partial [Yoonia sp.]|uniref:hypothetical protein n=1 Tax=Yoonia sp. TaxID=2212373 RepID=UPI0039752995
SAGLLIPHVPKVGFLFEMPNIGLPFNWMPRHTVTSVPFVVGTFTAAGPATFHIADKAGRETSAVPVTAKAFCDVESLSQF